MGYRLTICGIEESWCKINRFNQLVTGGAAGFISGSAGVTDYQRYFNGILIVVVVKMALNSPPIGMNVVVIKGMAPDVPLTTIYEAVLPFVIAQAVLLVFLLVFPEIATWLPQTAR